MLTYQKQRVVISNANGEAVPMPSLRERTLWLAFRQALLMIVDAIEVYIGIETRTAELRKRSR